MKNKYWGIAIEANIFTDRWTYYKGMMKYIAQLENGWSDKNMIMVF